MTVSGLPSRFRKWENFGMGQLGLFTKAQLDVMRDRTKSRRYSPEKEAFRREHERHRAWGLVQRHSQKLRRLHGGDGIVALTAAMLGRADQACDQPGPAHPQPTPAHASPAVAHPEPRPRTPAQPSLHPEFTPAHASPAIAPPRAHARARQPSYRALRAHARARQPDRRAPPASARARQPSRRAPPTVPPRRQSATARAPQAAGGRGIPAKQLRNSARRRRCRALRPRAAFRLRMPRPATGQ